MRLRITGKHVYRAGLIAMMVLMCGVLLASHTANADWGNPAENYDYFSPEGYLAGGGYGAVVGSGLSTPGNIGDFENQILGIYQHGSWAKWDSNEGDWGGYKIGAAFIIQTMQGGTDHSMPDANSITNWENDLANPNLDMKIAWSCNDAYSDHDSGYVQVGGSGANYEGGVAWLTQEQCGNSIIFQSKSTDSHGNHTIYYTIRLLCGNPFGITNALPHYVPDHPPTGNFMSIACDPTKDEYVVKATWGDTDGSTKAEVTRNDGGVPPAQGGSSAGNPTAVGDTSATWYFKTTDLEDSSWPIKLKVWDREPAALGGALDGPDTEDTSSNTKPNCTPIGTITQYNGTCTTVNVKLWDPNEPDNDINYYLAVNGSPRQGAFKFTGGEGGAAVQKDVSAYPGFDYWKHNNVVLYGEDVDTHAVSNLANVTLPICGQVKCGTSSLPASVVAGVATPFDVTVTITGPPGTPGPKGATFTSIKIGGQTTSSGYSPANPTPASLLTSAMQSYTAPGSGTYTGSWTFGGGESYPASITCPLNRNITAVYEPYFTVLGGDISAGQGFGNGCTDDKTDADVEGYNTDSGGGPNYFGASSRGAAIATGDISQFATDLTNNVQSGSATNSVGGSTDGLLLATENAPPSGLAFGNSSTPGTTYGGQYLHNEPVSFSWCVPNYLTNAPAPTNGVFNPGSIPTAAGNYVYTYGGGTFPAMHLNPGVEITVISSGSVYLNGDIKFDGSGGYSGSPTNIPQFNLLVNGGNIYVDGGNVQELHGFYAAIPNGSNTGIIYSCSTGGVPSASAPTTSYSTCNNPLTFYGAVAAYELVPGRTYGNIAKAADSGSDQPAEQFVYTPELWLSGASGPTTSCAVDPTQTDCLYQSFTSLPPVL